MRVLFLYKDYAPVVGGIENHLRLLAEGLRRRAVDARILVTNTGPRTVQESIGGVPVVKTGRQLNISSAPISLAYFPWLRRLEQGVDIAHAHFPYPPAELAQLLLGRSRRFVLTYHSDIVRQRLLGTLYRPFLRLLLRRADLITASNPAIIRSSPFLQPLAAKCRVIHHGADLSRFAATSALVAEAAALRRRYPPDRPLILFVGRLRHYKGVDVLIRAMAQVEAHLLVVGSGPRESEWRQLAQELGLQSKITFRGECPDSELTATFHAADLFVLPSTNRAETWGAVQIEAMACGLPLISTELGTGTSYVNQHGETGLVVPPCEPAALAQAINQLLGNEPLRRQMGSAGVQRAQSLFSQDAMLDQLEAFYAEALATPPRRRQP